MDWLRTQLGEELYRQVDEKLKGQGKVALVNAADGSYVPAAMVEDERAALKSAREEAEALNTRLREAAGGLEEAEALRGQVEELRKAAEAREAGYEQELFKLRVRDAIRGGYSVHDADVVARLLEPEGLRWEGGRMEGLEEQMRELRKERGFLFRDEPAPRGGLEGAEIRPQAPVQTNAAVNNAIRAAANR